MIFTFLLITLSSALYGVDLAEYCATSTISCMRDLGYSDFIIIRTWQSLGCFDPNSHQNYLNALSAGYTNKQIETYFYPCVDCGDPAGQVTSYWNGIVENQMDVLRTWFDIEDYWNDYADNIVFFETLINTQRSIGFVCGIYTSYYMWSIIFTLDYQFKYASEYKLWYAHYDDWASFGDFTPFAGWSYPNTKQYVGEAWICSFDQDLNYRE